MEGEKPVEEAAFYMPYNLSSNWLVYKPLYEECKSFFDAEGKEVAYAGYELGEDNLWHKQWTLVDVPQPTIADFDAAMEEHLRTEREARGYTTREPDAYLNSSVHRWAQDARDWVAHRDAVMGYALALINAVDDGERDAPTLAEFNAGLPTIEWTYKEV